MSKVYIKLALEEENELFTKRYCFFNKYPQKCGSYILRSIFLFESA